MSTPPPIPEKRTIKRAIFTESKRFAQANSFDFRLVEGAQKQAEDWINANPNIEITQIETISCTTFAKTIVWHR